MARPLRIQYENAYYHVTCRGNARRLAMELLYRHGGLSQREIGLLMGIDYSSVSVGRKRFRTMAEQDKEYKRLVTRVQGILIQE